MKRTPEKPEVKLPKSLVVAVVFISTLPIFLNLLGVDFGSKGIPIDIEATAGMKTPQQLDAMFHALPGAFTHSLLEWTAFCVALFTVGLAFIHFTIKRDVATPVIGVALFCSGVMDAFHTLAADRLIAAVADNTNLIPFTWAISRVFNASIMITGVSIFLVRKKTRASSGIQIVIGAGMTFGLVAYCIIHYCATSENLPQTMFPDSPITRPWDIAPLLLFAIAGAFIFPMIHKQAPSLFTRALLLSVVPHIATQLHMAFGSTALFDNHFNVAHFLKIIAYLVPFLGLALDYVHTYQEEVRTTDFLIEQSVILEEANVALAIKNEELDEFTYVASHDLQEPLRKLQAYSQLLKEDLGDELPIEAEMDLKFITDAAERMQRQVQDLLSLSRVSRITISPERIEVDKCADRAIDALELAIREKGAIVSRETLSTVVADPAMLTHVFQNLIANAIKYCEADNPIIQLTSDREGERVTLGVLDKGIGIESKYREQIFMPFKRLHGRGKYEGSGVGLSICRKVVERHGGHIWVESEPELGSHFKFTLSDKN